MSADLKKRILSMFCCIVLLFGVCGNVYAAAEQPDVSIHVGTEESKLASFSVGAEHPWFVRCGIPSGQKKSDWQIQIRLDSGLQYRESSGLMILINREGKKLPLSSELHYTMEAEAAGETVIRIQLTGRGMAYVAENLSYGANKPQLQIRFSVCVLSGVPDGKELSGVAEIIRKNKPEGSGAVSEKASVYSGGIRIQKVNERGEGLAGAVFQLAREASPSELQDPDIRTKPLQIGEKAIQAVAVPFYTGESDAPAYQVVTDVSGGAVMHGLAAGNYYLVESHAPEGYNILNAPVRIRVTKYSHLSEADQIRDDAGRVIDSTVRIVATQYVLPQTGGAGILCLIFSGGSLVLCAMVLCILRQKKLLWRW